MSSVFFKSTTFCYAGENGALLFGRFFGQDFSTADRTGAIYGLIPSGKVALGKVAAAVKEFAAFGSALNDVSGAALARTLYSDFFPVAVGIQ